MGMSANRQLIRDARTRGYYCALCGCKTPTPLKSAEHIIPRSKGGANSLRNLTQSCRSCNSERGSRTHILPRFHPTTGERLAMHEIKRIMAAAARVSKRAAPVARSDP